MKLKEQCWSIPWTTTKQDTVFPLERSCDGFYLPLGETLSASVLDLFNYTLNFFGYITEARLLPLNICIVTLWIAYWLFLLTTGTWTLNPIGNNYLSRAKEKMYLVFIIEVLVVEKMCICQVFNISLGMQCCCDFRTWLTNSRFSSKDKSRVFLPPSFFFFNSFLSLWQSYRTIWELTATLMHYSIIKWHSHSL